MAVAPLSLSPRWQLWRAAGLGGLLLEEAVARPAQTSAPLPVKQDKAALDPPALLRTDDWPGPWQRILEKVKPAPIAWSYAELGKDLLLASNPERSAALREIIAHLRLPKGSSTFWPACLPEGVAAETALKSAPQDFFRAGLDLLEVRFLVVFGPGALRGSVYGRLRLTPFSEQVSEGRLVLALPEFASLLAERSRLNKVISFLDSVFSRFLLA